MSQITRDTAVLWKSALYGIAVLLVVVPGLLLGVSYADEQQWPWITDLRYILILCGLVILIGLRVTESVPKRGERELR